MMNRRSVIVDLAIMALIAVAAISGAVTSGSRNPSIAKSSSFSKSQVANTTSLSIAMTQIVAIQDVKLTAHKQTPLLGETV